MRYAIRVAEESSRLETYRVLVSEILRLQPQGMYTETRYYDLAHPSAPVREPTLEEILEEAGLEVIHEPA